MRTWGILGALIAALVGVCVWISTTAPPHEKEEVYRKPAPKNPPRDKASLTPGRVVRFDTSKGAIEFVMFEKDCPLTTARIADLVNHKIYDRAQFARVEPNRLVQTAVASGPLKPIKREILKGLLNEKGAVGMARATAPNSATSALYILMEPRHDLDYDYAVFGRIIRGMDVIEKLAVGDKILKATIRPSTKEDRALLMRSLKLEVERKVD